MRVLIIEDEALAAERLQKLLGEVASDIEVLAKLDSIKESVKWLMSNSADLIFLDIQLSDGLSFTIFEQVTIKTPVIFTTAYDQYAIKAFNLNSVSYLLKPVQKKELSESLQKYRSIKSIFSFDYNTLLSALSGKQETYRSRFLIQIGDKFSKVEVADIAYFYALEKNVFFKKHDGSNLPVDMSLDALEQALDPAIFFRINRRYLVSMKSITSMFAWSRSRIKLVLKPPPDNDMDTIVSIDRSANFKNWMNR